MNEIAVTIGSFAPGNAAQCATAGGAGRASTRIAPTHAATATRPRVAYATAKRFAYRGCWNMAGQRIHRRDGCGSEARRPRRWHDRRQGDRDLAGRQRARASGARVPALDASARLDRAGPGGLVARERESA